MDSKTIDNKFSEMNSRMIIYHHNEAKIEDDIEFLKEFFDFSIQYNKKIDYLNLTINEFRNLKNDYPQILKKCKISLFMKSINEISLSELKLLKQEYHILYVSVKDLSTFGDAYQISIDSIYKYKKIIQKITAGIDDNFLKNQEDREKIIFGILISNIMEHTEYDSNIQEKYKNKKTIHNDLSNEMLGLIKGKCVCRGYSGIVRDVFESVGIDTCIITGFSSSFDGHAWNQIKLDGEWYNIDVTWDRENILQTGKSYWLLKDDSSFENGYIIQNENGTREISHRMFSIKRTTGNVCKRILTEEEQSKYLHFSNLRKGNLVVSTLKNLKLGDIKLNITKMTLNMKKYKNNNTKHLRK